jgi:WD40 repeat protein
VRLWDTATGAQVLSLLYGEGVWEARFSPDDERLVVLPMDGTVRVLDSVPWARR